VRRSLVVSFLVLLLAAPCARAWTWPVDGPVLRPFSLGADPTPAASTAASTSARRRARRSWRLPEGP
jgi:hypothetical protein